MRSPLIPITVEEYLKLEQDAEIRHEYVAGQIYAMTGSSREHNLIATNLISLLRPHLRGGDCRAFISDMKVKIQTSSQRGNFFYYPDVVVTCNPQDRKRYFLNSSCLIIEVLSPSTQATYKREKLINYQSLDSLQEYVLVSQYEIKAEVYRRDDQENWTIETLNKDQELQLNSVGLTLTMKDIYEDVFSL
ncbi:MAG: Uma2 family endonuclease [Cyanobacteria bacterium J06558_2]